MPIRIEKIDAVKDAVIRYTYNRYTVGLQMLLRLQQGVSIFNLEGNVLYPFGSVWVPAHRRLGGQLKEGQYIATPSI